MNHIVYRVVNGKTYSLDQLGMSGKKIKQVYTILDHERLLHKYDPQSGEPVEVSIENPNLTHNHTVFVEDVMHDWHVFKDQLNLHMHSTEKGAVVDLLIVTD